jgi:hypothetical protein
MRVLYHFDVQLTFSRHLPTYDVHLHHELENN